MRAGKPAVFLDRDGTLLTERGYLTDVCKMKFYPSVMSALRRLKKAGYRLVVVTNQSAVGRGYLSMAGLRSINRAFAAALRAGGAGVDGIYFCPHAPDGGCRCRKPQPYLLKQAARRWKIPLSSSFVVGDQLTDIGMAAAAGCAPVLVLTGSGRSNRVRAQRSGAKVTSNIATAADWILSHRLKS